MTVRNVRRMVSDSHDPKQRIVGGIVLFLLVLLLYGILKLVLSFFAVGESNYKLHEPLPDEVLTNQEAEGTNTDTTQIARLNQRLPQKFVFLDLNGNPMQAETVGLPDSSVEIVPETNPTGEKWVVQIASFKENSRAESLVQQLKDKGMEAEIAKIGNWYTVRLLPQADRSAAERQGRQVTSLGLPGIRQPLIKKIE